MNDPQYLCVDDSSDHSYKEMNYYKRDNQMDEAHYVTADVSSDDSY